MARFQIDAAVVFQLGESLISDEFQALVELVKNSYDADATECTVLIQTGGAPPDYSEFPEAKGYLLVEDNGFGMDRETIESGWLTIANSPKRAMKAEGKRTRKGRTPLGDKGLGRLGVQRLGTNVEVWSKAKNSIGQYVNYSWHKFRAGIDLEKVPVKVKEDNALSQIGTRLLISDLVIAKHQAEDWADELVTEMSRLISPYDEFNDFDLHVSVNGVERDLIKIARQIRNAAPLKYDISFDGTALEVQGSVRLSYLRPLSRSQKPYFRRYVEEDRGERFLRWLLEHKKEARDLRIRRSSEEGWYLQFSIHRPFDDMDKVIAVDGKLVNPGPFKGYVYYYSFVSDDQASSTAFGKLSELKQAVRKLNGVRVYRDGFEVRMGQDWLQLGTQFTSGRSFYELRPANTLGYLSITARDNAELEEVTDREGFKKTPAFLNFEKIMQEFVSFAADCQRVMRRGWQEFYGELIPTSQTVSVEKPPEDVARDIANRVAGVLDSERGIREGLDELVKGFSSGRAKPAEPQARADYDSNLEKLEALRTELAAHTDKLDDIKKDTSFLSQQVKNLTDHFSEYYEMVSLGLTAEALTHEILNVLEHLGSQTQSFEAHLRKQKLFDSTLGQYAENVKFAVSALRKQLAHLAPALKYVRERKEEVDLLGFLRDYVAFWQERLKKSNIELLLDPNRSDTTIRLLINRGKLVQVLDNLVLNSEYWLKSWISRGEARGGRIIITADGPILTISDDGPGIDPIIEASLFEPFRSTKPRGQGRGLGLFIVRQLLDTMNCNVIVIPERNNRNRFYKFEIDLTGAVQD